MQLPQIVDHMRLLPHQVRFLRQFDGLPTDEIRRRFRRRFSVDISDDAVNNFFGRQNADQQQELVLTATPGLEPELQLA
jgi:hypothetical protein